MSITFICLILCTILSFTNAYRILGIFPHFGKSHFDIFQPVMEELSDRGHDVTVLSYFPMPNAGYKDLVLHSSTYTGGDFVGFGMIVEGYQGRFNEPHLVHTLAKETCTEGLQSAPVRQLLSTPKSKKFDLILIEAFNTDCYLGLVYRLGAPFIHLSSSALIPWYSARFGQPDNPSYIPNMLMAFADSMTFHERVINTLGTIYSNLFYKYLITPDDNQYARNAFGDDLPSLDDIANNASMLIINDHFTMLRPKPLVPSVINVLGVHLNKKRVQKLPQVMLKDNLLKIDMLSIVLDDICGVLSGSKMDNYKHSIYRFHNCM